MSSYLLDSNLLSEVTKPRPDINVLKWMDIHSEDSSISTISLGEIWKGIELLPVGNRRSRYVSWLTALESDYDDRILPADRAIMRQWGELCAKHEVSGRKLPILDSLIAATALIHDLTVVTRNTKDFPPEVRTFNPWTG